MRQKRRNKPARCHIATQRTSSGVNEPSLVTKLVIDWPLVGGAISWACLSVCLSVCLVVRTITFELDDL